MNKRYNNIEMLKRNMERIHTAPYYAEAARQLIAQQRQQEWYATNGEMDQPEMEFEIEFIPERDIN